MQLGVEYFGKRDRGSQCVQRARRLSKATAILWNIPGS
jgi:hypothetical protein